MLILNLRFGMCDLVCSWLAGWLAVGCAVKAATSVFAFPSDNHCETFAFRGRLNRLCKLLKHIFANKVGVERNFPYGFLGTHSHAFVVATTEGKCCSQTCLRAVKGTVSIQGERAVKTI